jgi:hypothetical protein
MKRGEFERLIQHHLDDVLRPRGFSLTPQPPADVEDAEPFAVYEANPKDFVRRYPKFADGTLGDQPCVDLWIKQDRKTGRLFCELEGDRLTDLLEHADLSDVGATIGRTGVNGSLADQLDALAVRIVAALDANRA